MCTGGGTGGGCTRGKCLDHLDQAPGMKAKERTKPAPVADCWSNVWPFIEADMRREHGELVVVPQPPDERGCRRLAVYRASDHQPALPATRP